MSGTPFLRTERLELWRPQAGDLPDLIDLVADEETRRFLGPQTPDAKSQFERLLRQAGGWSLHGYGSLYARLPGEHAIVGSLGLFHSWRGFGKGVDDVPEAGWIIHRDHRGKGFADEAMRAILTWFDQAHGPRRIAAMIAHGNGASEMLAGKLGFVSYDEHELEGTTLTLYERLPG